VSTDPGTVVPFRHRPNGTLPARDPSRCTKCGSGFVEREPAFVHCRYCGSLDRIVEGSLADQELYELRSGLRLAS
jgi:hypothetical protein